MMGREVHRIQDAWRQLKQRRLRATESLPDVVKKIGSEVLPPEMPDFPSPPPSPPSSPISDASGGFGEDDMELLGLLEPFELPPFMSDATLATTVASQAIAQAVNQCEAEVRTVAHEASRLQSAQAVAVVEIGPLNLGDCQQGSPIRRLGRMMQGKQVTIEMITMDKLLGHPQFVEGVCSQNGWKLPIIQSEEYNTMLMLADDARHTKEDTPVYEWVRGLLDYYDGVNILTAPVMDCSQGSNRRRLNWQSASRERQLLWMLADAAYHVNRNSGWATDERTPLLIIAGSTLELPKLMMHGLLSILFNETVTDDLLPSDVANQSVICALRSAGGDAYVAEQILMSKQAMARTLQNKRRLPPIQFAPIRRLRPIVDDSIPADEMLGAQPGALAVHASQTGGLSLVEMCGRRVRNNGRWFHQIVKPNCRRPWRGDRSGEQRAARYQPAAAEGSRRLGLRRW